MKDILKRVIIGAITWSLIGYLCFLFMTNAQIVQSQFINFSVIYYLILGIVFFYLFIFFGVYPRYFKMTKATLFVIGLALIIVGDTVLVNDVAQKIYISDLCKLLWAILTILAWTNVLVTAKAKKEKEESKIEVIEV